MADKNFTASFETRSEKRCLKCNEIKPLIGFGKRSKCPDGLHTWCKECVSALKKRYWHSATDEQIAQRKARREAWYEKNKEKVKESNSAYYRKNHVEMRAVSQAHYRNNIDRYKETYQAYYEANKERILDWHRGYRKDNRGLVNERSAAYIKRRKAEDPVYDLKIRVRANIAGRMRAMGYTKRSRTHEIVGCDWEALKQHIERQFTKSMSWDNRDLWHIDHIVPMASAKTEDEVIALNHFTNLRPMWAKENISKGATITHLI